MTKLFGLLVCGVLLSATVGCGTILKPGPDMVPVQSNPEGASVYLDDMPAGKTPCMVSVNRESEGVFTLKAPGYQTIIIDRDKVYNGVSLLGFFIDFYTITLVVDICTGDIGKYSTDRIYVNMMPKDDVEPKPQGKGPAESKANPSSGAVTPPSQAPK